MNRPAADPAAEPTEPESAIVPAQPGAAGEPGRPGAAGSAQFDAAGVSGESGPAGGSAEPAPAAAWVPPRWLDPALKILGGVIAVGLAIALALLGVFCVPLRGFGVHLPVSLLLAVLGNPALAWFAYVATGRRTAGLLPAAAWCLVWLVASSRTGEGDMLLTDTNWVGPTTLLVGPVAFAAAIFVLITRAPRPVLRPPTADPRDLGSEPSR